MWMWMWDVGCEMWMLDVDVGCKINNNLQSNNQINIKIKAGKNCPE